MLSHLEFLNDVYQQVNFNPRQAQTIYEKARDSILSNHRDAVDCAAALFDAATSLHKQPPSDAEWKLLDDIRASSDRLTPSNDETRKRRALASLVAIWSWDVVCHYGWTGSSRTTVELSGSALCHFLTLDRKWYRSGGTYWYVDTRNRCSTAVCQASANIIHLRREVSHARRSPHTTFNFLLLSGKMVATLDPMLMA
jgi:hypothetical protein